MAQPDENHDPQSETVSPPYQGQVEPRRSKQSPLWLAIGLVLLAALAIALVWAAIAAA